MRLAGRQGRHGMSLGILLGLYAKQHMSIRAKWDEALMVAELCVQKHMIICEAAHEHQGALG